MRDIAMKSIVISVVAVLMLVSVGWAQSTDVATLNAAGQNNPLGVKPAANPFSLLDMSRIRWSSSYSVGFFSGGGISGSQGLLNTTMFYELSPTLSLAFNLGILHNTSALLGNGSTSATVLPGFRLDWRPSEKFQLMLNVQRVSGLGAPYYFGSPSYWSNPW
jgi:hypothetical protein